MSQRLVKYKRNKLDQEMCLQFLILKFLATETWGLMDPQNKTRKFQTHFVADKWHDVPRPPIMSLMCSGDLRKTILEKVQEEIECV